MATVFLVVCAGAALLIPSRPAAARALEPALASERS